MIDDDERLERIVSAVLDEMLTSAWHIGEAMTVLTEEEYAAQDQAHADRDGERLLALRDAAVRRVLRPEAERIALKELRRAA
ncbi:hypothetical protein [Thauera aromatica]|uniref:hypothetical protein n=1 Tax=Thauera aromatica TaxID=59405 RepID=UPI001FFDBB65|nr:hypothetical protein [Thauera aromatica]MCK2097719.1 hypothetical protein [Thauera aromatica]